MPPNPPASPTTAEVLSQLEDIERSGKVRGDKLKILRFVVAQKLNGHAHEIKGATISIEVLGRPKNFARADDSTVRVQMGALRKQLTEYYSEERWRKSVIIDIPVGVYEPFFSYANPSEQFNAAATAALHSAQLAAEKLTLPAFSDALRYLDRILLEYPEHPLVLAIKADIHTYRAMHGLWPRPELEAAETLAKRAIELSPDLWQAHVAYGYVRAVRGDWVGAKEAFSRVRGARQDDGPVHPSYAGFLVSVGETDEAIRLTKIGAESAKGYYGGPGPTSAVICFDLAFVQVMGGYLSDAKATLDSAISRFPGFFMLHLFSAVLQEALDDPLGAALILRDAPIRWSESAATWGMKALFYGLAGAKWRSRMELAKLLAVSKFHYVPASQLAIAYLGLGQYQEAVKWLRRMAQDGDPSVVWLGHFPFLRHLRNVPEFNDLLTEIGLSWRWSRR